MIRVKMYITINVDEEEYPVPADENVAEEIEDSIREYFYDIDGAEIKNIILNLNHVGMNGQKKLVTWIAKNSF